MRGTRLISAAALALAFVPASADAAAPTNPLCAPLFVSTIGPGDLETLSRRLPPTGEAQMPLAPSGVALPARIDLRTSTESFNKRYEVALRDGRLYFRPRASSGRTGPWRERPLPPCIAGRLRAISLDDDELLAIDVDRQIFTMDYALSDPTLWNWTYRWGAVTWTGPGRTLPTDVKAWSWSVISPSLDVAWTDPAGNRTAIGQGKVSHVFMLTADGRRIPWIDPWLPIDDSYEMCAPKRGRLRMLNLSASGSTVFVVGRRGELYTRLYDFDLSGSDPVFFRYSYDDQRGVANPAIQLPPPAWIRQPAVPGRITRFVSVEKQGLYAIHRTLRVEGVDRRGRTGYWEKDVTATSSRAWAFRRTGLPLRGRLLRTDQPRSASIAADRGQDRRYVLQSPPAGLTAGLDDFNPVCSPARLRVTPPGGSPVTLLLHTADGIRQTPRAAGLDNVPRAYPGAIEVPPGAASATNDATRAWLTTTFGGRRFTTQDVTATSGGVRLAGLGWTFTLAG